MPRSFLNETLTGRQIAQAISSSRRDFLRQATGAAVAGTLLRPYPLSALAMPHARKAVVVTFGGGARDDETFAPGGQDNIPHMLADLAPRSTFFSQVINRGILGHYVATASLATGVYETFNNFSAVSRIIPLFSNISAKISTVRQLTPGSLRPATASTALVKAPIAATGLV